MKGNCFNYMLVFCLFVQQGLIAQIPSNYYDTANGLSGEVLKHSLHNIIDDHIEFPYTSSSTDVWDVLKISNQHPNNPDSVILIYSGVSSDAASEYANGSGWNREHVWAKSRGDFGTATGVGTDIHNLTPADISVNSARSNRWFQECAIPYYDNGTFTGSYTCGSSLWAWEPRDEVKGDVARMLFYMDTRYQGDNGEINLELIDFIPSDNGTKDPIHARLTTLVQWHLEDPVDAFELNRNEVIYSYQDNRNPFIDNPSFVCQIWELECLTLPLDLISFNLEYQESDNQVLLFWRTENQVNSSHFVIQRSQDAENWTSIGELQADQGEVRFSYEFADTKAFAGNNYYRLKMVDFDGRFEYSDIQIAKIKQEIVTSLQVYPNPANTHCTINFPSTNGEKMEVRIHDSLGKLVFHENIMLVQNTTEFKIDVESFPAGIYTIHLQNKFDTHIARLIKH